MAVTKSTGFAQNYQAEWSYEDGEEGTYPVLVAMYEDDWESGGWLARLPGVGTAPPAGDFPEFTAFRLQKRTVSREAGQKVKVTLRYESGYKIDEDPGEPVKRYSMQITLGEEPIMTHERYADLPEVERDALVQILAGQRFKTDEGKDLWRDDITTELGLEALAKVDAGIEQYREPKLIWRERFRVDWDDWEEAANVVDSGNIDEDVPGDPPAGGNRNYLYLGPQLEQDESGEFADLVREWELSGRNGWDEDIYNPVDN